MNAGQRLTQEEWTAIKTIKEKLEVRGVEVVDFELGHSVKVRFWCRTYASVDALFNLAKNGRLRDILVEVFNCIVKWDSHKDMKLKYALEQFTKAQDIFMKFGNPLTVSTFASI